MYRLGEGLGGKRVLVTGATSGIGVCIAKLFAVYGAYVGLHYKSDEEQAVKISKEIKDSSGMAEIFQGDLLDNEVRRNLVESFVKRWGGIDILVNNAGACYEYKHFLELEEEAWDKTIIVNAKAPFFLSRDAFRYMKENKWGRIINISTVAVKYGGAHSLHYCVSKAALDALTIGLAREGAKYNILVNSIRCGVIDTAMHKKVQGYNEADFAKRVDLIPLKRPGEPRDIASMVLFLASKCGDFITGVVYPVAGGE